jgi:glycosyltransferase involved in cell wall biosynthesis
MTEPNGDETTPLVTAVIPTKNRPEMVCRAVRSALRQTYLNLDVVVVVDGPDPATIDALESLNEPRLKIVALDENVGGSEARNIGVREASGEWIALLDDDDEWLPRKLEVQIATALQSQITYPVVTCRFRARRDAGDSIMPLRMPRGDEPLSEYLFCRKSLRYGEGIIQTSTIVAPRALFAIVGFSPKLPRHQDWDWLLRVAELKDVRIEWCWEALALFNLRSGHERVSRRIRVIESLKWARGNTHLTKRAYSYFVATVVVPQFDVLRDYRLLAKLARDLLLYGQLEFGALAFGLFFALFPKRLLKQVVRTRVLTSRAPQEVMSS